MNGNLRRPKHRPLWIAAIVVFVGVAAFAWSRVGLLDLPSVRSDLTLESAGLAHLPQMKQLDDALYSADAAAGSLSISANLIRDGLTQVRNGYFTLGLEKMRQGVSLDPDNVVLGNAYRREVFRLRRDALTASRQSPNPVSQVPRYIEREPIAFFESLVKTHPSPQTRLNLALAWVDEMLLFPALEIKAPSSVESVNVLTLLLDGQNSDFVPALFARGLNHLHRPARLVWPETDKTPRDAAVQDIGRCIAIGRKFEAGSPHLQATLALAMGDAYVKIGKLSNGRSWWQIAQNLCRDEVIRQSVNRRFSWRDEETLDKLEEELDRARSQLDEPMTDLRLMWN